MLLLALLFYQYILGTEYDSIIVCHIALFLDGFSTFPKIMTYFPEEINDSNLPPHWNMTNSLLPTSPTVILDVTAGN